RNLLSRVGVLVVLDALYERARAVADTDDRDADLLVTSAVAPGAVRSSINGAHAWKSSSIKDTQPETTLAPRRGYTAAGSLSALRTCQTRCTTVKAVSAAIT